MDVKKRSIKSFAITICRNKDANLLCLEPLAFSA
ncbi:hypothetical protein GDO86_001342 [Hymenochirus boettgeri]|uniref:Uncharacterized protein n=1 Tax=Hymenochirus boettgeri TaxID=247094 RepID=A0A8T2KFD1_9PIPI|nr:hypothetical protein GDO86_001342 [Hymenochirus boettgeri]